MAVSRDLLEIFFSLIEPIINRVKQFCLQIRLKKFSFNARRGLQTVQRHNWCWQFANFGFSKIYFSDSAQCYPPRSHLFRWYIRENELFIGGPMQIGLIHEIKKSQKSRDTATLTQISDPSHAKNYCGQPISKNRFYMEGSKRNTRFILQHFQ